jgi:hypothetical protein
VVLSDWFHYGALHPENARRRRSRRKVEGGFGEQLLAGVAYERHRRRLCAVTGAGVGSVDLNRAQPVDNGPNDRFWC